MRPLLQSNPTNHLLFLPQHRIHSWWPVFSVRKISGIFGFGNVSVVLRGHISISLCECDLRDTIRSGNTGKCDQRADHLSVYSFNLILPSCGNLLLVAWYIVQIRLFKSFDYCPRSLTTTPQHLKMQTYLCKQSILKIKLLKLKHKGLTFLISPFAEDISEILGHHWTIMHIENKWTW